MEQFGKLFYAKYNDQTRFITKLEPFDHTQDSLLAVLPSFIFIPFLLQWQKWDRATEA